MGGFDSESGKFFYFNERTGESVWEKPKALGDDDVALTGRSRAAAKKAGKIRPGAAVRIPEGEEEAAKIIQKWWRGSCARGRLRDIISNAYTKGFDTATKQFYYYNTKTGTSLWQKPKILGIATPRLTPRSASAARSLGVTPKPRRLAADLSQHQAAILIQSAARMRTAFLTLQNLAEQYYQKGYDPDLDVFFYWNTKTNESQWHKPYSLGSADLELTPRSLIGAKKAGRVAKRASRWTSSSLNPSAAATILQSWIRSQQCRSHLIPLVKAVLKKSFDPQSNAFFWYNVHTGVSSWNKPRLLRNIPSAELELTPRSMIAYLNHRNEENRKSRQILSANDMDDSTAAFKIQGMYRSWTARHRLRSIIRSLYKPVLLGSSDIRRSFVHTGTLSVQDAAAAALAAAQTAGYTIGEAAIRGF